MKTAEQAAKNLKDKTSATIIMVFAPGVDTLYADFPSDAQFVLADWDSKTVNSLAAAVATKITSSTLLGLIICHLRSVRYW